MLVVCALNIYYVIIGVQGQNEFWFLNLVAALFSFAFGLRLILEDE